MCNGWMEKDRMERATTKRGLIPVHLKMSIFGQLCYHCSLDLDENKS